MSLPVSNYGIAMTICRLTLTSMGVAGNIMSFIIFSRKTFRNNSISTYCRALAVLDCLILIQFIADVYSFINLTAFYNMNDTSCKLFYYFSILYTSIPGWILVAFSVDKMLNMRTSSPSIIKSKFFQWLVVAGIVIIHFILFVELLISLQVVPLFFMPSIKFCNFPFLSYFTLFVYINFSEACVIPFAIMIVSSIVTIRLLKKSRSSIERIGNADKKRRSRDIKYAISSVTFNVFFIAFKTPFIISPLVPLSSSTDLFIDISFILFLFDCSSNFFIHLATNSIFRRTFAVFENWRDCK